MRVIRYTALIAVSLAQAGCQQSVSPPPFRALAGSDRVSVLCREKSTGEGRDIHACPDSTDAIGDYAEERHTIALVTQLYRGEVAAIDLTDGVVIDEEPAFPGTEFLPVGAMPTSIVSTPGGIASFVGVAQPGIEGIFALPTKCIMPLAGGAGPARELSLWPACRLSSRPGELAIIADASTLGATTSSTCNGAALATASNLDAECPADLKNEELVIPVGRRKLVVTLPDEGAVAVFDAQSILNAPAGTFGDCVPEARLSLRTDVPPDDTIVQPVPSDLGGGTKHDYKIKPAAALTSVPAGMAAAEGKLYIADLGVPLIHVLDVTEPCLVREVEPLRPVDFDVPDRLVYTSSISVSAPTLAGKPQGQRFLYATDVEAGSSAMVFDLSSSSRAPIVRPHTPELPFEAPDRIRFEAPIKKLALISHDAPSVDPDTNTGEVGAFCNPYPEAEGTDTLYRTAADYSKGAGPRKLRGIFGIMSLATGQMAAVDVEDWDAPCRRPKSNNTSTTGTDWLGCANDSTLGQGAWFGTSDITTVSDEASCNVIESHRMRSGRYVRTDSTLGAMAPSVANFPRLSSKESGDLSTGVADSEHNHPQMLAVPYAAIDCANAADSSGVFLNVGTNRYDQCSIGLSALDTEPTTAQHNTLILPMVEPRVFPPTEEFQVTYEGVIVAERTSGQLPQYSAATAAERKLRPDQILLSDPDAWFCNQGVEDYEQALATGKELIDYATIRAGVAATMQAARPVGEPAPTPEELETAAQEAFRQAPEQFALTHADYVELTGDFDDNDPYFSSEQRNIDGCLELFSERDRISGCRALFGTAKVTKPAREFVIRQAQSDELIIEPRNTDDPVTLVKQTHCCFPNVHSYKVRAAHQWVVRGASLLHNIRSNGAKCVKEISPRRQLLRSRAFEISSHSQDCTSGTGALSVSVPCGIGPANLTEDVCVLMDVNRAASPSEFGANQPLRNSCLFESIKGRFAIYRGQMPSVRDMSFKWSVTGGFVPLSTTIASASVGLNVIPMDMIYSEPLNAMVVIDGASGGVNLIDLTTFSPLRQPFL